MDTHPTHQKLISLQEAEILLDVPVSVLLKWNEVNILKPTITHTGQVGYTSVQLEEFLRIKAAMQPQMPAPVQPATTNSLPSAIQKEFVPLPSSPSHSRLISPSFMLLSSLGIVVFVSLIFVTQDGKLTSALRQYEQSYQISSATNKPTDTSSSHLQVNSPIALGMTPSGDTALHQSETKSAFSKKVVAVISQTTTPTPTITRNSTVPIATVAAAAIHRPQNTHLQDTPEVVTYANKVTFASKSSPNSSFDTNGNIVGTPKDDLLASVIGGSQVLNTNNPSQQNSLNLRNQLLVIAMMGLGGLIYVFKKPHTKKDSKEEFVDTSDKVFEVDQKMDGTVVIRAQGKEHKISKPELDSDSDQFISTLMKLVASNEKEIEYDTFTENKLKFSAPLSRLVTRLGFVGVKRDLFFPRTSKNRVLFRKYITRHDLQAMHMSLDQVLKEITLIV